jgi:PAS domain S-box-containing protein
LPTRKPESPVVRLYGRYGFALLAALLYAAVGLLWIVYSDTLISGLAASTDQLSSWQSLKGGFFVISTAAAIFALLAWRSPPVVYEPVRTGQVPQSAHSWSIRGQLAALVALVMLPLAVVLGVDVYLNTQDNMRSAAASAYQLAKITVTDTESTLDELKSILGELAKRPAIRRANPANCDPVFQDFPAARRQSFTNLVLLSPQGVPMCSSMATSPSIRTAVDPTYYLDRVKYERRLVIGKPARGFITGRWVVTVAQPVFDDRDQLTGVLAIPIDLVRFQPVAATSSMPAGSIVAIFNREGVIVARSQDAAARVGQNSSDVPIVRVALAQRDGTARSEGYGGVERIYGFAPIPGTDWYALAGIPTAVLFGDAIATASRNAAFLLALLVVVASLAALLAHRIAQPIRRIAAAAAAIGAGDTALRVSPGGSAEIAEVARELNHMLDALAGERTRLVASEVKFREIFHNTLDPMWIIDVREPQHAVYEDWNSALSAAAGLPREQAIGRAPREIWPDWMAEKIEAQLGNCLATGMPDTYQEEWPLPGGKRMWVSSHVPLRDDSGRIVRIAGIARDITETRRSEEEIRKLSSEQQTLLDVSMVGIAFLIGRKIVRCNPEFARMFGYRRGEVTGMSMAELHPSKTDSDERATVVYRTLDQVGVFSAEALMRQKDGTLFNCQISIRSVQPGNEAMGYVWAGIDTTARHNAEKEVRQLATELEERVRLRTEDLADSNRRLEVANRELEIANRQLASFSYSISHDLRAPLRAIAGYAKRLQDTAAASLSVESQRLFARIGSNAMSMNTLVDDLLAFARNSQAEMKLQEFGLADIVRTVVEEQREAYPSAEIIVGALPRIVGDPAMLRQVMVNLIGNALKFSARNPAPRIEIGMLDDGTIFVRDNGVGFDMAYAGKLFGVFARLHSVGEFEGTGVGLAIVRQVVERHGGDVWASAAPEQGATFYISLRSAPLPATASSSLSDAI